MDGHGAAADHGAEDLAGDGSHECAVDGFGGPASGEAGVAEGAGGRVGAHPVLHDVEERRVGLPVPAGEPVARTPEPDGGTVSFPCSSGPCSRTDGKLVRFTVCEEG